MHGIFPVLGLGGGSQAGRPGRESRQGCWKGLDREAGQGREQGQTGRLGREAGRVRQGGQAARLAGSDREAGQRGQQGNTLYTLRTAVLIDGTQAASVLRA